MIKGLSHITFICQDLEKSAQFLQKVFDVKEVYSSGDKTFSLSKERFFMIGNIWIAIMEGESVSQTYNHVAFHVDEKDLPKFENEIKALGLSILPGRKRDKAEG